MAGGSEERSALAAEVLRVLGNAIGARPCRVHASDLRINVESAGHATFPDGSVICGPLEQHRPRPAATALNPSVLLEVTSDLGGRPCRVWRARSWWTRSTARARLRNGSVALATELVGSSAKLTTRGVLF